MSRDSVKSDSFAAIPGFYGKLPTRGDFVARHLPRSFLDPWDKWLQTALIQSRAQLAERWLDCYLTSPLWRFALSPGICGQDAFTGVLMPSVDRVGRYFPLLIAISLQQRDTLLTLVENGTWFQQAEAVILKGLDDHLDLEEFAAQVQGLGTPPVSPASEKSTAASNAGKTPWHCPLGKLSGFSGVGSALAEYLLPQYFGRYSLWWTHGSEHIDPCLLICQGLPPSEGFAALLTSDWTRHGWAEQPLSSFSE